MLSTTWRCLKCFTNNQICLCSNEDYIDYCENEITGEIKESNKWTNPFAKYCTS